MRFLHSFKTAISGLRSHKSRSFLTILGIVIGITAIILVMSVGKGAENLILSQVQGLGTRTIAVVPGREPKGPSDFAQVFSDSLKEKELEALQRKDNVPTLEQIMPVVFGGENGSYGNETYRLTIFGGSEMITQIFDLKVSEGNFLTQSDVRGRADVVVLGAKVKEELFGSSDAIGEKIKIKGRNFRVIGVLPKKGQVSFFNFDEDIGRTVRDIELTLRGLHDIDSAKKDDFFVETQEDLASRLGTITQVLTLLLVSIAAISLVVGGVGIMNIMLVSVTERTREIGLRKAIGATEKDVLMQFLLEATILTSIGGVVGIALGAMFSLLISFALSGILGLDWKFSFPMLAAFLGLAVSAIIGLVFGLYPAWQASKNSPIEALRYE